MIASIAAKLIPTYTPIPTPMVLKPIIQIVQTHSPLIDGVDIRQYIGLSGVAVVESFVNYLQDQWKLPVKFAPVASWISGVVLNVAIALYLHTDLQMAIGIGLCTGLLASGYHEITK